MKAKHAQASLEHPVEKLAQEAFARKFWPSAGYIPALRGSAD